MTEIRLPKLETGGEETWSILAGRYDPASNPVTQEGIDAAARQAEAMYPAYPTTALERMTDGETLIYAAGLCNPGLLTDRFSEVALRADFGMAGMLLFRNGFSALQTRLREELDRLGNPRAPVEDAIDDMLEKELINSYKAEELRTLIRVAVIKEKDGNLPPMQATR